MMSVIYFLSVFLSLMYPGRQDAFVRREKLSDYHFFEGALRDLSPSEGVIPYTINTALFSNYAEKSRFFTLPVGAKISYRDSAVLAFPKGTILIKTFYYPRDFRKAEAGALILETRLLVHEEAGWQAYPYIWNDEQTEAFYDPAGETRTVKYVNTAGKKVTTPYIIPNKNQCKGCHLQGRAMVPVGPSARQLNAVVEYEGKKKNQLEHWKELGLLEGMPPLPALPAGVVWDDVNSGSLNDRARAYLDANCAHCHSRNGPANTSGLFLDVYENNSSHLGVNKSPVAAGRGAGNLLFDIVPGEPNKSILVYRMKTNDLSIAMPEIGREQVHAEGLALIEEWIRTNTFSKH